MITEEAFVETKNRIWTDKAIKKAQDQLSTLKRLANRESKHVELYSRKEIPDNFKTWLNKNNIHFFEG